MDKTPRYGREVFVGRGSSRPHGFRCCPPPCKGRTPTGEFLAIAVSRGGVLISRIANLRKYHSINFQLPTGLLVPEIINSRSGNWDNVTPTLGRGTASI